MRLSLHYNPSCPERVRQAKRTAQLDWLRAIELRTDRSPLGEVPVGEIVVVDEQSRRFFTGVYPPVALHRAATCIRRASRVIGSCCEYGVLLGVRNDAKGVCPACA